MSVWCLITLIQLLTGQLFQNKADRGGQITSEKQSSFEHDMKSIVNQNQRGENLTAGETARNTSPQEEVARGSRENSVERLPIPSTIDKIIKRAKCSRSGTQALSLNLEAIHC